jgi:hypothetical protein
MRVEKLVANRRNHHIGRCEKIEAERAGAGATVRRVDGELWYIILGF